MVHPRPDHPEYVTPPESDPDLAPPSYLEAMDERDSREAALEAYDAIASVMATPSPDQDAALQRTDDDTYIMPTAIIMIIISLTLARWVKFGRIIRYADDFYVTVQGEYLNISRWLYYHVAELMLMN